jgi:hypothetical protein
VGGPSAGPGILPDLAGPAGTEIYMKEALEQVVELFRAPARIPNENECFKGLNHPEKIACSTLTVQVCL